MGSRFFSMEFRQPIFSAAPGKSLYRRTDAKHPLYIHYLSEAAQQVIGEVHPKTAPARAVLEAEGFRYLNYIDIFDGGPTLECEIDRIRAIRKSKVLTASEGEAEVHWPLCGGELRLSAVPRGAAAGRCRIRSGSD